MFPILYEDVTIGTIPQHHGLGVLSDCISCKVEQARNDIYELVLEYPITGIHAEEFALRRVIKAKPNYTDNPQLFIIDRIGKTMNGKFTVYAKHVSYLLSGFEIVSGTANNAAAACVLLQNSANGFTISTDKTVTANFKIHTPASVKSYFVGREGSFLDVFGKADIKYDNFDVQFKQNGGTDRGVTINYAKNLLELSQEIRETNLYTQVRCFWKQNDEVAYGNPVDTGLRLDVPKCLLVDVTTEYQSKPSTAQLTTRANKYKNDNNLTVPTNNITLDFVQSGELASRVDLFDTVSVYYEALGITRTQVRCIRTVWDVIREKYIETEFGDSRTTAAATIAGNTVKLSNTPTMSYMDSAVKHATELITGNLGGYVVLNDSNNDGEPDELLIMDKPDISDATNVWRFNQNGLGHANSYAGQYGLALTKDGQIVADKITSGTLNANIIKAGVISDAAGKFSLNMVSGVATMKDLNAKNSLVLVNDNGLNRGEIRYNTSNGAGLYLKDPNGNYTAQLVAGSNNDAYLEMFTPEGKNTIQIKSQTWGGSVRCRDSSTGNIRAEMYCVSGAGALTMYNSSQKSVLQLGRYYEGGSVEVKNDSGNTVAWLFANSGTGNGALIIRQSSGTSVIDLDGNNGKITCVSLTQTSSRKVKKNISPIKDAAKILELQAVSFDYKDEAQGTDKRGFIAEEVQEVLPNLVTPETKTKDMDRPATLDYIQMIPYLQDVIKQQQKQINDLAKRVTDLENGTTK